MKEKKEKPTLVDLAAQLEGIIEQLELARGKGAGDVNEDDRAEALVSPSKEAWNRFLCSVGEAEHTANQILALDFNSVVEEALECLSVLGSTQDVFARPDLRKAEQISPSGGGIENDMENYTVLLDKLRQLPNKLLTASLRSFLCRRLWAIACTLERYAIDAINDDPTSVYSFSETTEGIEKPMNALIDDINSAKKTATYVSYSLAKNTLIVLEELDKSILAANDRIVKTLTHDGPFDPPLLLAKRAMRDSFRALRKDYYSKLKDLSIEFQFAGQLGIPITTKGEVLEGRANHTSYYWDKPLTENELRSTEARYGPLVNTLPELAELVRKADRSSKSGLDAVGTHTVTNFIDESYELYEDKNLSQDTYKTVIRAHASARKLRPKIEMVVGPEQAARFYDDLREVLGFDRTSYPEEKGMKWAGDEGKAEGIAKSLYQWHHNLTLIMKLETPDSKQKTKPGKKPEANIRGRPRKYSGEQLNRMLNAYEECYQESNDSKGAWSKVANLYGVKTGDAARVACMNYRKKLKKST